jgi:hypothetical protein
VGGGGAAAEEMSAATEGQLVSGARGRLGVRTDQGHARQSARKAARKAEAKRRRRHQMRERPRWGKKVIRVWQ